MTRTPDVPIAQDAEVLALRDELGHDPSAILEVLKAIKRKAGIVSAEILREIARAYQVPEHRVSGIASFYSLISTGREPEKTFRICDGIACWTQGADDWIVRCEQLAQDTDMKIVRQSCLGLCDLAPAALFETKQLGQGEIDTSTWEEMIDSCREHPGSLPEQRVGETRFLLRRPTVDGQPSLANISSLKRVLQSSPDTILTMIEQAELHGRGGAGYSTARKWKQVAAQQADQIYIVCNADESEPLSIKDRTLIDADPFRLLEGMLIAGLTVGANRGIIYIRGEYEPQAIKLEQAIAEMRQADCLGENLLGTAFSFDIEVHRGAGAYICGEETALLESLEGKRGEPRSRPPYPGQTGLHHCPTVVNNVETLCTVSALCEYGLEEFQQIRLGTRFGTKLYGLFGCIQQPGLFEAPRGLTLGELIDIYGGGISSDLEFSFAVVGGAAGTFVSRDHWEHELGFSHAEDVIPLGTGGVLVCDTTHSVPEMLREILHFFERESCGKCTPCRIGTRETRQLLDRLIDGSGQQADLDRLEQLSSTLKLSLCGLGTSVPSPLRSALKYFRLEFEQLLTAY